MTTKKPNILQVLPSLISGGVERGTIDIANALSERKYGSFIASSGGKLTKMLNKEVFHFTINTFSKNPYRIYRNINLLKKIIKENDIDIIHARSRAPAWSCYFAAKSTNIKFITTFHGIYNHQNFAKRYYNSIMTKSDKTIAVSKFVKNHIEIIYKKENIDVIYRGCDTDYFNPQSINKIQSNNLKKDLFNYDLPIILLPGRLTDWKGHLYLLESMKLLKPKTNCLIVGDDKNHHNYREKLNNFIDDNNLVAYVKILPNQNDIIRFYDIADIIVSASTRPEAFGRIIVEGQSMQKLVIATNIGGACETIINDKTGFTVPINDTEEFRKKIEYVLDLTKAEKEQITTNARLNVIKNFSLKSMIDKTMDIYDNI